MKQIKANNLPAIPLGKQGENLARQIVFDITYWVNEFGTGTPVLIHKRYGDEQPYPVTVSIDETLIAWDVTNIDTQFASDQGQCELRYYVGDIIVKSRIWRTIVDDAMETPSEEAPEHPYQGWVDKVVEAGAEAKQAADRAENAVVHAPIIGENGDWFVWDSTKGAYIDTGRYSGGSAPYIGANGNWFIGTNDSGVSATGPEGPSGRDGADGQPGRDGRDGFDGAPGRDGVDGKDGLPGEKGDPFRYEDFTPEQLEALRGPQGAPGPAGSDANVTAENIESALGYTPANEERVTQLKSDIANVQLAVSAKMDSYTIKTAMDSIAEPHTQYYLGNQTAVDIVLPDSADVGQIIMVCWYNGETAATLSITGTMLDFDFAPSANTRSEINALWDGTYWAVLGNEMAVPKEVTE